MKTLYVAFMISILATMAVVTGVDMIPEAEALKKGKGVDLPKYGSGTKGIVCGDQLCSEVGHKKSSTTLDTMKKHTSKSDTMMYPSASMSKGGISVDSIRGATVIDTSVDSQSGIVVVSLDAVDDGKVIVNLPSMFKDVFMVIVDGEEWDDAFIEGNQVKVYFYAGTEKIEIIGDA